MAKRTKSGLKRKRQNVKRAFRNQAVQSRIKTLIKGVREGRQPGAEALRAAVSALDSAARTGVIHPNAAARKKSRLVRWAAQTQPSSPA